MHTVCVLVVSDLPAPLVVSSVCALLVVSSIRVLDPGPNGLLAVDLGPAPFDAFGE